MRNKSVQVAFRTSFAYWLISALWILVSDRGVLFISHDPTVMATLSMYKGWGFVTFTAVLLFATLRGQLGRWEKEVTTRKRAEEALRDVEVRFSKVFQASPMAIGISRLRDSKFIDVNDAFLDLYGYSREEVINHTSDELGLWHEEDRATLVQTLRGKKRLQNVETRGRRKSGDTCDLLASLEMIELEGQQCIVGMLTDISERKRSEQALNESEERYRSLFENNQSVMLLIDPGTGTIVDANPAACVFYGYPREGIRQLRITDINQLTDEQVLEEMREAGTGHHKQFYFQHRLADDDVRDVEVYSGPITLQGKSLLYSIVHDITDRKRTERALVESLEHYQTLSQTIPFGMQVVDATGTVLYANGHLRTHTQGEVRGRKCWELYKDDRKQCPACPLHKPTPPDRTAVVEVDGVAGGRAFQIHHTGMTFEGRPAVLEIFQDITEERQSALRILELNRKLEQQNTELDAERARWQGVVEGIVEEVWFCDVDGRMRLMNPPGKTSAGLHEFGDSSMEEILSADGQPRSPGQSPLLRSLRGEIVRDEEAMRHRITGKTRYRRFSSAPTRDRDGRITGAVAIVRDITERKEAEEEIVRMNRVLSRAEQMAHLGAWEIDFSNRGDLNANPLRWSDEVYRIFGYEPGRIQPTNELFFGRVHPDDRERVRDAVARAITEKHPYLIEHRVIRPDGTERVVIEYADVTYDRQDQPLQMRGAVQDITERKTADETLLHSLHEKELLLKEVHHRVKNNMQIISSMLRLQSRTVSDPAARAMLEESQNRIRSMSLIHEQLYSTENLAQISLHDYINSLTQNLLRSYARGESRITIDLQADRDLSLDLDTAIPCGLIINELVSNALKYAFPGGMEGTLQIHLHRVDEETHRILIGDNGVGLPHGFDAAKSQTLGLQLVHSLVKELHGDIHIDTNHGTVFTITFGGPKYRKRI